MLCMKPSINLALTIRDYHSSKQQMDRGKSSLPNIPVSQKQQTKKAYGSNNNSDDNDSEKSDDSEKKPTIINADMLRPYDILCGRDKAVFNNIGNRRFRVLNSMYIQRYDAARTKAEKAKAIKDICYIYKEEVGVRFLKKYENGDDYIELNDSDARKKVGHALRDMSVARSDLKRKRESEQQRPDTDEFIRRRGSTLSGDPFEPLPIVEQPLVRDLPRQIPQSPPQQMNLDAERMDLQQTLARLQHQQQILQEERERLLQEQEQQQRMFERALHRHRSLQQQQQSQSQSQQQQQQQQQLQLQLQPQQQQQHLLQQQQLFNHLQDDYDDFDSNRLDFQLGQKRQRRR